MISQLKPEETYVTIRQIQIPEILMATKFKLCSFKTCPWVHRAAIVLQEKNIDYEIEYIDRDNRPAWFLAISPHSKVPVLIVDDDKALFESNAIAEYLDEVTLPRLHPKDALKRAYNRAWNDFVPVCSKITHLTDAENEEDLSKRCDEVRIIFEKLEKALLQRGDGRPYFNGAEFSLTDASYAPALMRFTFFDRIHPLGLIEEFPFVAAWRDALMARPSVLAAVVPDFEHYWQEVLREKGRWASQFVPGAAAAE